MKFAIFILSHNNCNNIKTEKSLISSGYSGNYYILIDDKDSQIENYKNKYSDKLIIFSKEKIKSEIDLMDNFNNYSSAVYARNFCYKVAKELNYDFFVMIDDDISNFLYIFPNGNKLKKVRIKNIDKVFEEIINFMTKCNKLSVVAFSQDGGNFGGITGRYLQGYSRTISQCMICNTNNAIDFCGTQGEDLNASLKDLNKITMELFCLAVVSPTRGTNSSMYKNLGLYKSCFYSVMLFPSAIKIKRKKDFTLKRKYKNIFPKIMGMR